MPTMLEPVPWKRQQKDLLKEKSGIYLLGHVNYLKKKGALHPGHEWPGFSALDDKNVLDRLLVKEIVLVNKTPGKTIFSETDIAKMVNVISLLLLYKFNREPGGYRHELSDNEIILANLAYPTTLQLINRTTNICGFSWKLTKNR